MATSGQIVKIAKYRHNKLSRPIVGYLNTSGQIVQVQRRGM